MADLAQSLLGLSWALSLLGVRVAQRQAQSLLACCPGRTAPPAAAALDAVTWAAEAELGDVARSLLGSLDGAQRQLVDRGLDLCDPRAWAAGAPLAAAVELARHGGRFLASLGDREARGELAAKWRVYWRVRGVEGRARDVSMPLAAAVAAAYELAPFATLFELEGLGHDHALARCAGRERGEPHGLLLAATTGPLPESSLILLHAGMGMAFAQRALAGLTPAHSATEIDRALHRFAGLCRANSRPGYAEAALESLGLVARTFNPRLVPLLSRRLLAGSPELAACFWHGAGRAAYFLPVHFLPGQTGLDPALDLLLAEAPASCRLDAVEGLAYAACMVNMERPEGFAALLRASGGRLPAAALAGGVRAAVAARRDTTPGDPAVDRFLAHVPADPASAGRWEKSVRRPSLEALAAYPRLKAAGRLGIFARHCSQELQELSGETAA